MIQLEPPYQVKIVLSTLPTNYFFVYMIYLSIQPNNAISLSNDIKYICLTDGLELTCVQTFQRVVNVFKFADKLL